MQKEITKIITVCDLCGNEFDRVYRTVEYDCEVCKKTVCSSCKSKEGYGFSSSTAFLWNDICIKCAALPEVKEIVEKFKEKFQKAKDEERAAHQPSSTTTGDARNANGTTKRTTCAAESSA